MGKFEDEIRRKLQEGEMQFDPSHWEQMSKNLSDNPPLSQFEEKLKDTLGDADAADSAPSWDEFNSNFNSLNKFEKGIKEKLSSENASIKGSNWEAFSEKLAESELTGFEKGVKSIFNSGKIKYNPAHWKALEKQLHGNSFKKIFFRSAAAVLLLLGLGYGINKSITNSTNSGVVSNSNVDLKDKNSKSNIKVTSIKNETVQSNKSIDLKDQFDISDIDKSNSIQNSLSNSNIDRGLINNEKSFIPTNQDNKLDNPRVAKKDINNNQKQPAIIDLLKKDEVKNENEIFSINKRVELCSPVEILFSQSIPETKKDFKISIHPGATLWLNFWDNPAITGIYGKNNISGFYHNDWETIDENKDQVGELNFVQPLVYMGAYERRLGKHFAIGAHYKYQLEKNWNNRETTVSASYTKTFANQIELKVGAGSTYRNHNLAVNRLTLREKALNSDYIFTTELGDLKSRQEISFTHHIGAFINHEWFYLGYTGFNIESNSITNEDEVILTKHVLTSAIHAPEFFKFKASGLFKYEKDLFKTYSPGVGLTYDDKVFAVAEYEALLRKKISVGYVWRKRLRAQASFVLQDLDDFQREQLNLDKFVERRGYINAGLNWSF